MPRGMRVSMRQEQERLREEALQEAFRRGKVSEPRFSAVFALTAFAPLRKRCRKVADSPQAWTVLHRLLRFRGQWVNDVSSWKPKGKSVTTLLKSLIRHLICKYPMPSFWYEVWFRGTERMYRHRNGALDGAPIDDGAFSFCDMFVKLAQGHGMYKLVKKGGFPVALTKKQCHAFMQQKKVNNVVHATRWTVVRSFGGERSLAKALCDTRWGEGFGARETEVFRGTVIQWFCAQGMLDMSQLGPLIDYIEFCRENVPEWAITGRTVVSLMRDMEQWHADLVADRQAQRRASWDARRKPPPEKFESCGIGDWKHHLKRKDSQTGKQVQEFHTIQELLTYKGLHEEGRELRHCVTSYAWNIGRGATSIWSYSMNGDKILTIELANSTKTIRQVRGYRNRMPTSGEMNYVQRWASENALLIAPSAVRRGW